MLERVLPGLVGAVLGLFAMGCGGDSEVESEPALSDEAIASFESSYVLESFNENPSGCDSEGASTFADKVERRFVLVGARYFGGSYLKLASCTDETECAERTQAIRNGSGYGMEYSLLLSAELDPDTLTGFSTGSGYLTDDLCGRDFTDHELVREGDLVRVTSRTKLLANKPQVDGFCVVEPRVQEAEAEERDCSTLTTFTGRRSAPLP